MFDAGALIFRIQAQGAQVFRRDVAEADKAADALGKSTQKAADGASAFGAAAEKSQKGTKSFREELSGLSDEGQRAAREVGGALTGIGAAFLATAGLATKAAIDWESAWAGVTKTVDGTPEQLDAIQAGLRGMAEELPASHEEIAAVAEAAGQLGVQTDSLLGFTRTMIDLGETTNLTSDEAATALAQFMNIMGTAGKDVDRLGSTVVALGNDGASTEADIVSMAQRIAGSGKLVGATEGEVLALSNALASMGVTAELGGGVASRILQDLYSAVQTGGESLQAFADVAGMSADDFAAAFENDPIRAMGAFATGLNGVEKSGGNVVQTLSDLGFKSTEEQRVLLQLKSAGDLLTDSLDLQSSAWDENNALQNEAEKRYETTAAQLQMMRNSITDAAIDMGQVFLPVLSRVAEDVSEVTGFIADMPPELQGMIVVLGTGAGAVALFGGAMLLAVPKIVEFNAARATLTTQMPRLSGALKGVTSFLTGPWGIGIAAGMLALEGFKGLIESTQASSEEMQGALQNVDDASEIIDTFTQGSGVKWWKDSAKDFEDMDEMLDKSIDQWEHWWKRLPGIGYGSETHAFQGTLRDMGEQLSTLADSDLASAQEAFSVLADETDGTREHLWALLSEMAPYRDSLIEVAEAQGINLDAMSESERQTTLLDIAMGNTAQTNEDAAEVAQTAAAQYLEESDAVKSVTDELNALIEKLNETNDMNDDAITASSDYEAALDAVRDQVDRIAAGEEGYAYGLDLATEAGRDNMQMLQDQAQASQDAAEKQFALDGNTEAYVQRLRDGRDALIQNAQDLGATREEAENLADRIYQIPGEKEVRILAETQAAQDRIAAFQRLLDSVPSTKSVTMQATLTDYSSWDSNGNGMLDPGEQGYGVIKPKANGDVIRAYASGAVENHQAQIARAGEWRVWAEPETGGETYVPHAVEKRARAESIMAETASIFGGTYIPAGAARHANGSVSPAPVGGGGALRVELVDRTGLRLSDYIDVRIRQADQARDDYIGGLG